MPILMITNHDMDALKNFALAAKHHFTNPTVQLLMEADLIALNEPEPGDELAAQVAAAIAPKSHEQSYRSFLRGILLGRDSLDMSEGEAAFSIRPYSKMVTERLKKAFPKRDVIKEHLYRSEQTYMPDGSYKAIKYLLTDFGLAVFQMLSESRALDFSGPATHGD